MVRDSTYNYTSMSQPTVLSMLHGFTSSKRGRSILLIIFVVYCIFSTRWSYLRMINQFNIKRLKLPTTSHADDINLKTFSVVEHDKIRDLREQLAFAYPYDPRQPIPKRIWQTWKVDVSSPDFPASFRTNNKEWSSKSFDYSLIPDDHLIPFLENLYGEVPMVLEAFNSMPVNILKADFLRYLMLFARGGIYSDMDTIPLKPLDSWPSVNVQELSKLKSLTKPIPYKNSMTVTEFKHEPGFIIGIEADPDRSDWSDWYARRIQFCQWTIQAKPGHPILRELILNITATTLNSVGSTKSNTRLLIDSEHEEDYNVNYRHNRRNNNGYDHSATKDNTNVDGTDIMNWTGPGIFSDIIFDYINNLLKKNTDISIHNSNLDEERLVQLNREMGKEISADKTTLKFSNEIMRSLQSNNRISWEFFSLITEPVLVDDIMVLPITCFSPDVGQMGAKSSNDKMAFVKHLFSGSWKDSADKNAGH